MKSAITMPDTQKGDNLARLKQPKLSRPAVILALARESSAQGLLLLLVSTAFAEVAGSAVYVILIERAYVLGSGATSAGIVLLVQSATQAIFGFGAGSLVDTWGYRKTAMIAGLVVAGLATGLAFAQTVLIVYMLAFLLMMARLLLLPARFGLIPQLSNKSQFVQANSALSLLSGAGGFVGPAMVTAILLLTDSITPILLFTTAGSLLSILPLALINLPPASQRVTSQINVWWEMRQGWQVIRRRSTIRQLLFCLINVALLLAAVTPLFTLLARRFGLGSEGTGAFFTALGLGYLVGPLLAIALFKRMRLSNALLLSGLVGPIGAILIGIPQRLEIVLAAVALIAIAGASVTVLVTTVVQRLTPQEFQGSVYGVEQALVGLAWTFSIAAITGATAVWQVENVQILFLSLGVIALLSVLSCWLWSKRPIEMACDMCEARSQFAAVACMITRGMNLQLPGVITGLTCGKECQCHN